MKILSTYYSTPVNVGKILTLLIIFGFSHFAYALDSIPNSIDPSFNPQIYSNSFASKTVTAVISQPDGKNLISGYFNSYNRIPVGSLVRINSDGTLDSSFDNNAFKYFTAGPSKLILQDDGKILVGGNNFILNGQTSNTRKLVRLNSNGTIDSSFHYQTGGTFSSMEIDNFGRVLVQGSFQIDVNGTIEAAQVIRLNPDGSLDTSFRFATTEFVAGIASQGSKTIINSNNATQNLTYRLLENGSIDSAFTRKIVPSAGFTRKVVVQPDLKILIVNSDNVVRLDSNGVDDTGFQTIPQVNVVEIKFTVDGRIVILDRNNANVQGRIKRYLPDGSADPTFSPFIFLTVPQTSVLARFAIQQDGSIWAGDETIGNAVGIGFMRITTNGSRDLTFNSGGLGFQRINPGSIRSIGVQSNGKVIIGGKFDEINGSPRNGLARFNADSSLDTSFNINLTGVGNSFRFLENIYSIKEQSDGKLLVTGSFSYTIGGSSKTGLVRLNSDGNIDTSFNLGVFVSPTFDVNGREMIKFGLLNDGKLLVGTSRSGSATQIPVRFMPNGSNDGSFTPSIYGSQNVGIYDVAIQPDAKIIICGYYQDANSITNSFIMRLNVNGSIDPTFTNTEVQGKENTALVLLSNGKILSVNRISGQQSRVVRLNSDGTLDTTFSANIGTDGKIETIISLPNGKILVGGSFSVFNGQPRQNLVQLNADGSLDPTLYNVNDAVLTLVSDNNGRVLVGGGFTIIGAGGTNANRSYVARLVDSSQIRRVAFDFDGDGRADLGSFKASTGLWSLRNSQSGQTAITNFGTGNDRISASDFDGDGRTDICVYRPSEGIWYILRSRDGFTAIRLGLAEDKPVSADYDGDGKADIALWRPSSGTWYILQSSSSQMVAANFGVSTDIPLRNADFDGDGKADIAVWRPSEGNFYWLASGSANQFNARHFGQLGDIPSVGDFNGDGKTDLVVFRPTDGTWYQNLSTQTSEYTFSATQFGTNGDEPVAADFDGDGKTDIAVRRQNIWHILKSGQGYSATAFANANDSAVMAIGN